MSDPFGPGIHQAELTDEEKTAQRDMCVILTREAVLAVDAFAMDHAGGGG